MGDTDNACSEVKKVNVKKSSSDFYEASLKKDDVYDIRGKKKGLVLILNNSFKDARTYRPGSELDVAHMKELWTQMGCDLYEGKAHEKKTAEEMKNLIIEVNDVGGYCFLVIIIMSHGSEESRTYNFQGSDGELVDNHDAFDLVNNKNSKRDARNIPKFFIFQTCRGSKIDEGVVQSDDCEYPPVPVLLNISGPVFGQRSPPRTPPHTSNILVAYGTMDGYAALRSPKYGSWFINAITNVFMHHAHEEHVADLLVKVQNEMQDMVGSYDNHECKAMSQHESSLTKKFFLFPGHPKPTSQE